MPFDALSANASEMVPVGAIDSRWLLRRPCWRIAFLISSGRRDANRGADEVRVDVESRERTLVLRDLHRRQVRGVAHRFGDPRRHRTPFVGVVAQVEHDQRVAEAGEAQADAPLVHRLLALLRQRPFGDVEHVVEHPHGDRNRRREAVEIELRVGRERVAHEAREIDAAEVAAAVGGQRLFATVVDFKAVGIERVDVCNGDVVDVFMAIIFDGCNGRRETLAVELASIIQERGLQSHRLVSVCKSDPFGKNLEIVPGNRKFVLRLRRICVQPASPVRHRPDLRGPTLAIKRRHDAETKQHSLRGLQQAFIALRQANADAFLLRALDRSISIEQSTQNASDEGRATALDLGGQSLVTTAHSPRFRKPEERYG